MDISQAARWENGLPLNLAAAAADADEWLRLFDHVVSRGLFKFSESDSLDRLKQCRETLQAFIRELEPPGFGSAPLDSALDEQPPDRPLSTSTSPFDSAQGRLSGTEGG